MCEAKELAPYVFLEAALGNGRHRSAHSLNDRLGLLLLKVLHLPLDVEKP
jgi:hypothetical protein